METSVNFDFYGVTVRVTSDDGEVARRVASDFSYFRTPDAADPVLGITACRRAPDYDALPPLKAKIYSPRNICYSDGDVTYIDYFGKALAIYDRERFTLRVESEDVHMLHEVIFLSILSRVCEKLEHRKMHRVHALAVAHDGEAALFMMPSGGGKTTLCMEFLRRDLPYRVVSEDSPLIDAKGRLLPFPLRFGVVGGKPEGIPDEQLTYVERMEFEPKYLISLEAFASSIETEPSRPRFVFIGDRTLGRDCVIRRVGWFTALRAFLRHMIVGVGLYQGVEFLLRASVLDLARGTGRFFSRFLRALSVIRKADVYALELGRDKSRNMSTILDFFATKGFGSRRESTSTEAPPPGEVDAE